MLPSLAAALLALAAAQVSGAAEDRTQTPQDPETGRAEVPAGSPEAASPGAVEIDGAGQTGIPSLPIVTASPAGFQGAALDLGLMSLLRVQTLGGTAETLAWGTDLEVTPGISLRAGFPTVNLAAGYAARLTIPFDSTGPAVAVLHLGFARTDWRIDPLWTLSVDASGTYGDYSQLQPVTSPGGTGAPPPALNPVRSFTTYPYLALVGTARASAQLSTRSRLRFSAGYVDVGGIGTEGAAAQPRTWGPVGGAAFEWDASRHALLTTAASYQDSVMVGGVAIQIGTVTESWVQNWTPDLESTVSCGAAYSSADAVTFLTYKHLLPVASIGVAYHTDVRHTVRLGLDLALAPYVDTYVQTAYQRATARAAFAWRPSSAVLVDFYLAGALVPYTAGAPDSYGTAGTSIGWAPLRILTLSLGGFTQSQIQSRVDGGGGFRQWTTYVSVTLRDTLSL